MGRAIRRVVIVGAGIGGPVLGIALCRLGVEVVLAERRDAPALAEGAFLGVAPNGMNVLAELGVADAVLARGFPCHAFAFSNRKGETIGSIDRRRDGEDFGWPLTMIRRADLHVVLAEEAARRGVDLRFGKRLVDVDRSRPDVVVARFADGSTVEGDLLVGCDGLRSRVRSLVVPEAAEPAFSGLLDFGGFASGVDVPVPPGVNAMVFGRRAFFGIFPTPSGELWWFHNGPPPEPSEEAMTTRERLLALHRDDPSWIGDVLRATPEILGPWPIHDLVGVPRWSHGRIGLLGDAAHAMSPSAGQGASMAMEDALVLAQCIRDVDDPSRVFEVFERARRPRVDAIARQARRNGSGKAVSGPVATFFRDRLLPFFLRLGASAQSRDYGYRIDWNARVA